MASPLFLLVLWKHPSFYINPMLGFRILTLNFQFSPISPPLLFCSFPFISMIAPEKSFKQALIPSKGESSNHTSKAKEADVMIGALDSSDSAEEAMDESQSESDEDNHVGLDPEYEEYVRKLSKVDKDIKIMKETCLIGKLWRGTVEFTRLKQKLIAEWSFVKGGFEVVDRSNNWFEIQFVNVMDKDLVWECRPYHVFGLLLVLMPWKESFSPDTEIVSLELWIRILSLPTEYMSFEMLQAILEYNKIGELIKLDTHTEQKSKAKYARVCVKVKYATTLKGFVILPDRANPKKSKTFQIWYEGVSEGCVNCGEQGHSFADCPKRTSIDRNIKVMIEKYQAKGLEQDNKDNKGAGEVKANESTVEEGWTKVGDRKGKKPMVESNKSKVKPKKTQAAGKGLKIWDVEDGKTVSKPDQGNRYREENSDPSNKENGHERKDAIVPTASESSDAVVPSISKHKMQQVAQENQALFPIAQGEMTGMDQSIFDFCGNLPLGTINEEGGYLLQDIVTSGLMSKKPILRTLEVIDDEETDVSFKSTHSRSSMVQKMNNMHVQKPDSSASGSGKRRQDDMEEDTASSATKRQKNIKA